ncbi:MAG: branched-chain amino acid transaminase [Amphritea sp.]
MIQNLDNVPKEGQNPIWFNGQLVPFQEANINIITHALNYGSGVFEGVRVYNTEKGISIFHLHDHLQRLVKSAEKFGIALPYTYAKMVQACIETVKASGHSHGYIRPQLQFGLSSPGLGNISVVEMSIFFWPMGKYRANDTLKVLLSDVERISPKSGDIEAKVVGFYTNSHFNHQFAHANDADDAIMLDVNGNVAEASSANVFFVKDGVLITPQTGYILKGITRKSVLDLAQNELGLEVQERVVTPDELESADEIFLTGTAAQIDPVTQYNGKPVGNGEVGQITGQLSTLYAQVTKAQLEQYLEWHTFV